jgi:hypothetical protein
MIDKKTEEFIRKAKAKHGDRYDYSKTVYVKSKEKVCITCKVHGEFLQRPNDHLKGKGCKKCAVEYTMNILRKGSDDIIEDFKNKHGDYYDYRLISQIEVISTATKLPIICRKHGVFYQHHSNHYHRGAGCPKCGIASRNEKKKIDKYHFIEKCKEIHGNKYTYTSLPDNFHLRRGKIKILCGDHGVFLQEAWGHLHGKGCPKCSYITTGISARTSKDEFIEKSKNIHGDKYSYDKVEYVNTKTKVTITCQKHGDFKQPPYCHLEGSGCPRCRNSKGEDTIEKYLISAELSFFRNYYIEGCKYKNKLFYDFYIPKYKLCIEFDGYQHFHPLKCFGGSIAHTTTKIRDAIKNTFCVNNNIGLIRIRYDEIGKIDEILQECITHGVKYRGLPP